MDLMLNPEAIRIFDTCAKIISFIRRFLDTCEFMEVSPQNLIYDVRHVVQFLTFLLLLKS
jgi:hypothetical protein